MSLTVNRRGLGFGAHVTTADTLHATSNVIHRPVSYSSVSIISQNDVMPTLNTF